MQITLEEFIRLAKNKDYQQLQKHDLTGLNVHGVDFSSSGLDYAAFVLFNLANADFGNCIFQQADFSVAVLREASFSRAILEGANLSQTDCEGTDFSFANLRAANISDAHAEKADFTGANLSAASLAGSFLVEAIFEGTEFNHRTILPNGTTWGDDTNLSRYTDPNHPEFWIDPGWNAEYVEEVMQRYKK
jgi:uncharacterized protein YjbI with pentapeptide repeats